MDKKGNKIDRVKAIELVEKALNNQLDVLKDIVVQDTEVFSIMAINNIINNITIAKDNTAFLGIMFKTELMGDESNKEDNTSI